MSVIPKLYKSIESDDGAKEVEVDGILVLQKKLKLRSAQGTLFPAEVFVYEVMNPYCLVMLVSTADYKQYRVDILKENMAKELREWLDGKHLRNPLLLIPSRIEETITRFVKFGKPPLQQDLVMWLLSRCELSTCANSSFIFGGTDDYHLPSDIKNNNNNNNNRDSSQLLSSTTTGSQLNEIILNGHEIMSTNSKVSRPSSAPMLSKSVSFGNNDAWASSKNNPDMNSYYLTQKLIGRSDALDQLKKEKVKGRQGAKVPLSINNMTSDQWRFAAGIEKARKDIEVAMEERRMAIEVCKERQKQHANKYGLIRDSVKSATNSNDWLSVAINELDNLHKIHAEICDDIKKQKSKAQRATQNLMWTIAPAGYANRRGKSSPGIVLGPGPLPASATTKMRNPKIDDTAKRFYWDAQGRRHEKEDALSIGNIDNTVVSSNNDTSNKSVIELAMDAIRLASANANAYKLDLKKVFDQFDTSGDGYITSKELVNAFISMGVKVDGITASALYHHFDPNGSGSIHYGEFAFAFFNSRSFTRQWKKSITGLTARQIESKFHASDINGNGIINNKEFVKLLKSFGIVISDTERKILYDKFDVNGDGDLDLNEIKLFLVDIDNYKPGGKSSTTSSTSSSTTKLRHRDDQSNTVRMGDNSNNSSTTHSSTTRSSTTHSSTTHSSTTHSSSSSSSSSTDRKINISNDGIYNGNNKDDGVKIDAMWMADILSKQNELENKLGRKYYDH